MKYRICLYNIEWFNNLFNEDNSLRTGVEEKKRLDAIKNVILHINPDFMGIVEAPNTSANDHEFTTTKLENFAARANLSVKKALTGFISGGSQEIAVLFNPDKFNVTHTPGGKTTSKSNPRFDGEFHFDTNDDRIKEIYKHFRPPLEVTIEVKQGGKKFKVIVVHTKSKGIFNSMDMMHWERENHRSRLKLFAECEWIRRRIDEFIEAGSNVIVMGDINDGPGMDYYEMKYGRSAVETIMGDIFEPEKILRNYAGKPTWTAYGWEPASTRFKDRMTGDNVNVLIDHVLVSSGLKVSGNSPHKIWNPYENKDAEQIKNDLFKASDHFPVSIDLEL